MSHMVERLADGHYSLAYAGEVPWHGLGKKVPGDLTPEQMLEAAHLDWEVEKVPAYATWENKKFPIDRAALVRKSDGKLLDVVSPDWNMIQNREAFEFFNDFVAEGHMDMHTAGSLRGGQLVWALAKIKDGFELFKGDRVDAYLLFTNPHKYGWATDVRFTPIRVVCNNTLTLSLAGKTDKVVRVSHRTVFDADEVKETLGVAKEKLAKYKEMAKFLGAKRYKDKTVMEYFREMFPSTSRDPDIDKSKELSRPARIGIDILETQPGADYAPGTWWNAFNSLTFLTDHVLGRSTDGRLVSSWYGYGRKIKTKGLEKAVEYADAA